MEDTIQFISNALESAYHKGIFIDGVASIIQRTLKGEYNTASEAAFILPYLTSFKDTVYIESLSYFIR